MPSSNRIRAARRAVPMSRVSRGQPAPMQVIDGCPLRYPSLLLESVTGGRSGLDFSFLGARRG